MEESQKNNNVQLKKLKHRSPNYPAIGLERALERASVIKSKAGLQYIFIPLAFNLWGYKESAGNQTVAALKAFGLVEVIGEKEKRQLRITDFARKILDNHPDKESLLKEAALKPDLHRELWEKYEGHAVADEVLRDYLIWERNFNREVVASFINQFRNTLAYANLFLDNKKTDIQKSLFDKGGEGKPMEQQLNSGNQGTGTAPPPPPPPAQPEYKPVKNESDLAFRISRDSRVRVIFTGEVTQEAIEKLRILLEHSKDTFPTKAEIEKPRTGIWRSKDLDMSVTVTGSAGVGTDGRRYVNIEGSDTAIPEDEIEYDSQ